MKDFLRNVLATMTGIVLLFVIMGILGAIALVGLAASSASSTKVEENSVFTLMLSGQLEERAEDNPLSSLTGQVSENLGLDDMLAANPDSFITRFIRERQVDSGICRLLHAGDLLHMQCR